MKLTMTSCDVARIPPPYFYRVSQFGRLCWHFESGWIGSTCDDAVVLPGGWMKKLWHSHVKCWDGLLQMKALILSDEMTAKQTRDSIVSFIIHRQVIWSSFRTYITVFILNAILNSFIDKSMRYLYSWVIASYENFNVFIRSVAFVTSTVSLFLLTWVTAAQ